jgi:hypothetical protein
MQKPIFPSLEKSQQKSSVFSDEKKSILYSGETKCQGLYADGRSCKELARHSVSASNSSSAKRNMNGDLLINNNGPTMKFLCGTHSKKYGNLRKDLPKNPNAADYRANLIKQRLIDAKNMSQNEELKHLPKVISTKLRMFKEYTFTPEFGYLPIFPNRKHNHGFGYGVDCSGLSPMKLGPVVHNQLNLPNAKNIENYHQFNKVFSSELSSILCECPRSKEWKHYKPNEDFYKKRIEAYNDDEPHRHKFDVNTIKKETKNVNIPCYSIHVDAKGNERHYTYIESRYFYCKQMEILARQSPDYTKLTNLLNQGYKLEILGYDAYRPKGYSAKDLYEHYCDSSRPFGHEMVILSLLMIDNEQYLPWNKYHDEHPNIYF